MMIGLRAQAGLLLLRLMPNLLFQEALTVRSEYDSEYYDTDFADQLAGYLFSKSHNPYFLICHAAFSDWGGSSHPWIGRRKDGAVVVEYLPDCLDALLQEPAAAVLA